MLENTYNAKQIAYMATQYDDAIHSVDAAICHALADEVYNDLYDDDIIALYLDWISENCYDPIYSLDNDTLNDVLFNLEPDEIVRKTLNGDFRYYDDYFSFDGYDNLVSFSESTLLEKAKNDHSFYLSLSDHVDWDMEWLEEARETYHELLKAGY